MSQEPDTKRYRDEEVSFTVEDIKNRDDQEAIFSLWNPARRMAVDWYDTFPCNEAPDHHGARGCRYSHKIVFDRAAARCLDCVKDRCPNPYRLVLKRIESRSGAVAKCYCVCKGFWFNLQNYVKKHQSSIGMIDEQSRIEIFHPAQTIHDTVVIPCCKSPPPPTADVKSSQDKKREREVDNGHVYLNVDANNLDNIISLMRHEKFEGILKVKTRKLEELAMNLTPDQVIGLQKELVALPIGKLLVQNAELTICNQKLMALQK